MALKRFYLLKKLCLVLFLYFEIFQCLCSTIGNTGYGNYNEDILSKKTNEGSLRKKFSNVFTNDINEDKKVSIYKNKGPFIETVSILSNRRIIPKSSDVCSSVQLMSFWRLYSVVIESVFQKVFPNGQISKELLKNNLDLNLIVNSSDVKELSDSEMLRLDILETINELNLDKKDDKDKDKNKNKNNDNELFLKFNKTDLIKDYFNESKVNDIFYDDIPFNFTKKCNSDHDNNQMSNKTKLKSKTKRTKKNKTNFKEGNTNKIPKIKHKILFGLQAYYPLN